MLQYLTVFQQSGPDKLAVNTPTIQLVFPAYVACVKACQVKDSDSIAFQAFKMNWAEAIELKWKPKIAEIHMIGFYLDPGMKHLPE